MRQPLLPLLPLLVSFLWVTAGFTLPSCVHVPPPPPDLETVHLDREHVDAVLQPGDFMFRYADPNDSLDSVISGAIIQAGAVTAESPFVAARLSEDLVNEIFSSDGRAFDRAVIEGDPSAVHMAIYLGEGRTAEAFGTTLDDASVGVWDLFAPYHRRASWRVLRHEDVRVRAAIAEVAERWAAPRRMGYRAPTDVFVEDAGWGERARDRAFDFAQSFATPGGPPGTDAMFCSEFAVGVLQSASATVVLPHDGPLAPGLLDALPVEARINAVSSPLRVYGEWMHSGAFSLIAQVIVD